MTTARDFDRGHIWHPYTSMTDPLPCYEAQSAQGMRIKLRDGRELIDGMSSWWCAIHGYNHPELNKALREQLDRMAHVMFGGLTHEPAIELAKRLIALTPERLQHVFFSDSGSVAVEVAIKMVNQYWIASGRSEKNRLMTVRGGYHGDTFAAMSVCDPVTGMHGLFTEILAQQIFLSRPSSRYGESLSDMEREELRSAFEEHHQETAAFIVEPIVQGAGGMWFYSVEYLKEVRALCDEFDVLLIFDEIATGFGRAGAMFASDMADVEPDVLCLGKAMTGGYLSQAATLASSKIARGISAGGGVLMHGPTFMANPLCCAVSLRSVDLLSEQDCLQKIGDIEAQLTAELAPYASHKAVADVRTLGAIGVVQTVGEVPVAQLQKLFVERGVWIRPFNDLIYLMPPYIATADDLTRLTNAVGTALDAL